MNTKIIILIFLSIAMHNNFCILINPNQAKFSKQKYTKQQINQKVANDFLKCFMLHSVFDNSEIFDNQSSAVQREVIRQSQIVENQLIRINPMIGLIQLPTEEQIKTILPLFDNQCEKAAIYFLSIPLEIALTKYNKLPENNLTLLQSKHTLSQSMIFRLTEKEQRIITKIYTEDTISTNEITYLKKSLAKASDILNNIQQHAPNITLYKYENKLSALLVSSYKALDNDPNRFLKNLKDFSICYNTEICLLTLLALPFKYGFNHIDKQTIFNYLKYMTKCMTIPTVLATFGSAFAHEIKCTYNNIKSKKITRPLKSLLQTLK